MQSILQISKDNYTFMYYQHINARKIYIQNSVKQVSKGTVVRPLHLYAKLWNSVQQKKELVVYLTEFAHT